MQNTRWRCWQHSPLPRRTPEAHGAAPLPLQDHATATVPAQGGARGGGARSAGHRQEPGAGPCNDCHSLGHPCRGGPRRNRRRPSRRPRRPAAAATAPHEGEAAAAAPPQPLSGSAGVAAPRRCGGHPAGACQPGRPLPAPAESVCGGGHRAPDPRGAGAGQRGGAAACVRGDGRAGGGAGGAGAAVACGGASGRAEPLQKPGSVPRRAAGRGAGAADPSGGRHPGALPAGGAAAAGGPGLFGPRDSSQDQQAAGLQPEQARRRQGPAGAQARMAGHSCRGLGAACGHSGRQGGAGRGPAVRHAGQEAPAVLPSPVQPAAGRQDTGGGRRGGGAGSERRFAACASMGVGIRQRCRRPQPLGQLICLATLECVCALPVVTQSPCR